MKCELCKEEATSFGYYTLCHTHSNKLRKYFEGYEMMLDASEDLGRLFRRKGVHRG